MLFLISESTILSRGLEIWVGVEKKNQNLFFQKQVHKGVVPASKAIPQKEK